MNCVLQRYHALAIGPIYGTMQQARSTREIWVSSYMFSCFAEEILKALSANGNVTLLGQKPTVHKYTVGRYSDRIFFATDTAADIDIEAIVRDAKNAIADVVNQTIADVADQLPDCHGFMQSYLQAYHVEFVSDHFDIKTLNNMLNAQEYYPAFRHTQKAEEDILLCFLNKTRLRECPWVADYIDYLPSLPNLALRSIAASTAIDYRVDEAERTPQTSDLGIDALWERWALHKTGDYPEKLPSYAHYTAFVHADGDGVGTFINGIEDAETYAELSDALLTFSGEASETVKDYGGLPIYFGGDDMVFIAPLFSKEEAWKGHFNADDAQSKNDLLALIDKLDALFIEHVVDKIVKRGADPSKLSLSYGVAVTYYKFPMNQMRDWSYELLARAKDAKGKDGEKNKVCWGLKKHSGQTSIFDLWKTPLATGPSIWSRFGDVIRAHIDSIALHAIHWKIIEQFALLFHILDQAANAAFRLEQWFENNFNESLAEKRINEGSYRPFVELLQMGYATCKVQAEKKHADAGACRKATKESLEALIDGIFRYDEFLHEGVSK